MQVSSSRYTEFVRDSLERLLLMVHVYVFEVTEPFTIGGVDAWKCDIFAWRADGVLQIRKLDGQYYRWRHPAHVTVSLLRHEDRLVCQDPNPPRLQELARLAVGGLHPGRAAPPPPPDSWGPPPLQLLK